MWDVGDYFMLIMPYDSRRDQSKLLVEPNICMMGSPRRIAGNQHYGHWADSALRAYWWDSHSAQNSVHPPNMNCAGKRLKVVTRAMFPAIVLVTWPPSSKAPRNSKMPAMTTADQILRVLEPTLVPKELATSLAPEAANIGRRKVLEEKLAVNHAQLQHVRKPGYCCGWGGCLLPLFLSAATDNIF